MRTQSQSDFAFADQLVARVNSEGADVRRIYRGLCQSFPVMVQTCGLCQALAFHQAKATGEGSRARAHSLVAEHASAVLAKVGCPRDQLSECDCVDYLQGTRSLLHAWIFFKRLAVSILDVPEAGDDE